MKPSGSIFYLAPAADWTQPQSGDRRGRPLCRVRADRLEGGGIRADRDSVGRGASTPDRSPAALLRLIDAIVREPGFTHEEITRGQNKSPLSSTQLPNQVFDPEPHDQPKDVGHKVFG